ncbi:hypothetical protein PV10_07607 [Exophiala mesophila]|uniref:Uncharacterized protein n=1 Tax=Exophiala mesophila TaxID=212818 RepID=A0A0D1ZU02_EXOME|nr:uncharacterized protein PV10_07607 [Exophiala mesophila]KIV90288.1 hypothetical protein PV10_07607 [Exophiala mesophila]
MPASSPSPMKRPSLNERTSSTVSLSSSGKQATTHKVHRPHVVNRHSRNASHGKGLSKLGKVHSTATLAADTARHQHQRKRSGGGTPPQSPGASLVRRNTSHAHLPKNSSHGNLRKNHSANTLARNLSHPALKKIGLAPAPKSKARGDGKDGVFQIGDHSSEDEEEGEWEDSTTHSPEMTRNNSKTSTPARAGTPNGEGHSQRPTNLGHVELGLRKNNRSAPNLIMVSSPSPDQLPSEPPLLHQNPRSSRAPPAMSTISARAGPAQITRTDSSRSFSRVEHVETASMNPTPTMSNAAASSSVDGGVSRFLSQDIPKPAPRVVQDESDSDSSTEFLSNYKPQPSESPEKPRSIHKARTTSQTQSRTQQKLDLQRREMVRLGASTMNTPPTPGLGLDLGSSTSLHSRTGSRSRTRNLGGGRSYMGESRATQQEYDVAVKQLSVVRRFRSPIVESVVRLKENGVFPEHVGLTPAGGPFSKGRPQSRRGPSTNSVQTAGKSGLSRSFEDQTTGFPASRSSTGGRSSRVHFQRQTSHDDIEVTPSQGSPGGSQEEDHDGLSPEEALLRRIWESRELYDSAEFVTPG